MNFFLRRAPRCAGGEGREGKNYAPRRRTLCRALVGGVSVRKKARGGSDFPPARVLGRIHRGQMQEVQWSNAIDLAWQERTCLVREQVLKVRRGEA